MLIHLFGSSSSSGIALQSFDRYEGFAPTFVSYTRNYSQVGFCRQYADLLKPELFQPIGDYDLPSIWISFAPIWLFSCFFEYISVHNPACLRAVKGLIVCSSSSVVTKRFAVNQYDRELFARLSTSETLLLNVCQNLDISCTILQPALIYGKAGSLGDRNLSSLVWLMGVTPVLPVPSHSGLRQPIHVSQLAAVTMKLAHRMFVEEVVSVPHRLPLGGDVTISYLDMMRELQLALPPNHPDRR